MNSSNWKFFSLGLCTKHQAGASPFIQVIPYEYMTNVDGDVTKGYDGSTNTLQAKWLNLEGSSRSSPPNIRAGEKVHIYRYGELENGYYWTTVGSADMKLRKLEHVVTEWSDKKGQGEAGPADRYRMVISTKKGLFDFLSSVTNGEKAKFNINANFKKGILNFGWDTGVGIRLDANTRRMTLFGAGLTIKEGNLFVKKEATVIEDIIGKANCKITQKVTCMETNASVKVSAPLIQATTITAGGAITGTGVITGGGIVTGGAVTGSSIAGAAIAGGFVTSGGRPVLTV